MSKDENKDEPTKSVLRSIARKLTKTGEDESILGSVLETGDKAKTEIVRMIAKEVRSYLEALELHKDLKHILTNYSLEINASFNLKELNKQNETTEAESDPNDVNKGNDRVEEKK